MTATDITLSQLLKTVPPPWGEDLSAGISELVSRSSTKLVILDDDPTGTQTVHGIPVLTTWSVEVLVKELQTNGPGFFILTNSRSLRSEEADTLTREIGTNLKKAISATGVTIEIISRSDSTLRGHFPGEVDALMEAMETPGLPCILIPFFLEGGRLTANDVHYVADGDHLVPAAETPYARDAAFCYRHSNLREWVVEKTQGMVTDDRIISVTLDDIRSGGPSQVTHRLMALKKGDYCVVNALTYRDLEVFTAGLLEAQSRKQNFVFRSAASFVRVRAGINPRDYLSKKELIVNNGHGGLFIVGSYVPKTSAQLTELIADKEVAAVELQVDELLSDTQRSKAVEAAGETINQALIEGRDTVLFTSRKLITGENADTSLAIGQRVSDSLISIVRNIECTPRYLVAKGGITSSDVATKGIGVRRAMIMGQVLPGVPVWQLGGETRWPGMAYIVFPGNVGDDKALAVIRQNLTRTKG